ncbi:MAG: alpha/beta hydrolase [Moraxellaceae bacterium]
MSFKDTIARRVVKTSLRLSFKLPSILPLPVSALRTGMELGSQLFRVRKDVHVEALKLGGVSAECLSPAGKTDSVILHLHGGAFFAGSAKTHRAMGAEMAARAGATVYMLDYRLAPEHPYPAALDDALVAYQALLAQGHAAENIVLGGDSGGCAHILSLAIALREQGLPLPAGLIMISPYVDITLSLPSVLANRVRDPMVTAHALRRGSDAYRGRIPASDVRVSPLFADLQGLPPVLIQAGSEEILRDDALHLAQQLNAAGVEVDCRIHKGMWHNFQMFSAFIKAANTALDDIASFVRRLAARSKSAHKVAA